LSERAIKAHSPEWSNVLPWAASLRNNGAAYDDS
jgi:hypothetical protein